MEAKEEVEKTKIIDDTLIDNDNEEIDNADNDEDNEEEVKTENDEKKNWVIFFFRRSIWFFVC